MRREIGVINVSGESGTKRRVFGDPLIDVECKRRLVLVPSGQRDRRTRDDTLAVPLFDWSQLIGLDSEDSSRDHCIPMFGGLQTLLVLRDPGPRIVIGHVEPVVAAVDRLEPVERLEKRTFPRLILANQARDITDFDGHRIPDRLEIGDRERLEEHTRPLRVGCHRRAGSVSLTMNVT